MTIRIFLDGATGTTGLEIDKLLATEPTFEVLRLPHQQRRDESARREALASCEAAVLCLPDTAAREVAEWAHQTNTKLLDASTAHRIAPEWVYGFPELTTGQAERIASTGRVANPGCYSTGALTLLRPLAESGLLAPNWTPVFHSVSGYSGGGKQMIANFEETQGTDATSNFIAYGLNLRHKHLPEINAHGGHSSASMLLPSVGRFYRGMLVSLPLPKMAWQKPSPTLADLQSLYLGHFSDSDLIQVTETESLERLNPEALNHTNRLEISVFTDAETDSALAVACLDNLGKGAAGAAVQNLKLMFGA